MRNTAALRMAIQQSEMPDLYELRDAAREHDGSRSGMIASAAA
jgi:hypothetical protein